MSRVDQIPSSAAEGRIKPPLKKRKTLPKVKIYDKSNKDQFGVFYTEVGSWDI